MKVFLAVVCCAAASLALPRDFDSRESEEIILAAARAAAQAPVGAIAAPDGTVAAPVNRQQLQDQLIRELALSVEVNSKEDLSDKLLFNAAGQPVLSSAPGQLEAAPWNVNTAPLASTPQESLVKLLQSFDLPVNRQGRDDSSSDESFRRPFHPVSFEQPQRAPPVRVHPQHVPFASAESFEVLEFLGSIFNSQKRPQSSVPIATNPAEGAAAQVPIAQPSLASKPQVLPVESTLTQQLPSPSVAVAQPTFPAPAIEQPQSLTELITTQRQNNARVDAILKVLSSSENLVQLNLKLQEAPNDLRILPWAYRRIPFSFTFPLLNLQSQASLFGTNSEETSFEIVDEDEFLSRVPIPHRKQDGSVEYHLQLVEPDDDGFRKAVVNPNFAHRLHRRSADEEVVTEIAPSNDPITEFVLDTTEIAISLDGLQSESATDSDIPAVQDDSVPQKPANPASVLAASAPEASSDPVPESSQSSAPKPGNNIDEIASAGSENIPVHVQPPAAVLSGSFPVPVQDNSSNLGSSGLELLQSSKEFDVLLTGLESITRSRNTRVFQVPNGGRIIEAPVLIGPLSLQVIGTPSTIPARTRVLTRPMNALLTLEEIGGKISSVRLIPTRRMLPHYSQVTVESPDQREPDLNVAGRAVTQLSLEVTRAWNQGSLIELINNELRGVSAKSSKLHLLKHRYE